MSDGRLRIVFEGWRGIPHSYCVLGMNFGAHLARDPRFDVRWVDRPMPGKAWAVREGIIERHDERRVMQIPAPEPGWVPDAVVRMDYPLRLDRPPGAASHAPVFVLATSEFGLTTPAYFADAAAAEAGKHDAEIRIVSFTRWSCAGFTASGFVPERVHLVPLGIDPRVYRPIDAPERAALRARLWPRWHGTEHEPVVYYHTSAMTPNKNVADVLVAFAAVARDDPRARLLLKGLDAAYGSEGWLADAMKDLPAWQRDLIGQRSLYLGGALSPRRMAELYQAADCMVMPYTAEGFCLPVLEGAACGCPSICTAGGSTDDFTTDAFALRIPSDVCRGPVPGSKTLRPRLMDLIGHMRRVLSDGAWCRAARAAGPALAHGGYTWAGVSAQLADLVLGAGRRAGHGSAAG